MWGVANIISGAVKLANAIMGWFNRERLIGLGRKEKDADTLQAVMLGVAARNRVIRDPVHGKLLLGEILIEDDTSKRQLLSELQGGMPEVDGSLRHNTGDTGELCNLPRAVYPYGSGSLRQLNTCHSDLQRIFLELSHERDTTIIEGTRSIARQQELFDKGASKVLPGKSKHNRLPSDAVDAAPVEGPRAWARGKDISRKEYIVFAEQVMAIAKRLEIEIRWGGDWDMDGDYNDQSFNDLVHFERVT